MAEAEPVSLLLGLTTIFFFFSLYTRDHGIGTAMFTLPPLPDETQPDIGLLLYKNCKRYSLRKVCKKQEE